MVDWTENKSTRTHKPEPVGKGDIEEYNKYLERVLPALAQAQFEMLVPASGGEPDLALSTKVGEIVKHCNNITFSSFIEMRSDAIYGSQTTPHGNTEARVDQTLTARAAGKLPEQAQTIDLDSWDEDPVDFETQFFDTVGPQRPCYCICHTPPRPDDPFQPQEWHNSKHGCWLCTINHPESWHTMERLNSDFMGETGQTVGDSELFTNGAVEGGQDISGHLED